jgi:mannose-1-phosphate guanylyltransferase/mannose-6-phosphate isomerase
MLIPIVLAGGSGTRLWPKSRKAYPKQFINIIDGKSPFILTLNRVQNLNPDLVVVVCNTEYSYIVEEILKTYSFEFKIILEPIGKNTAPAISLACATINESFADYNPDLLVMPSDHYVKDDSAFNLVMRDARHYTNDSSIILFGIVPDSNHDNLSGFGYIECDEVYEKTGPINIKSFIEKPGFEKAINLIDTRKHLWNSGIFLFKLSAFINQAKAHCPKIFDLTQKSILGNDMSNNFINVDINTFNNCPSDSFDCAIMEKTNNGFVIPLNVGWSDIGTWSAIANLQEKDSNGNFSSNVDTSFINSKDCYVDGHGKLIVLNGLEDLIVVDTKDALLVSKKENSDEIKKFVNELLDNNRKESTYHREVIRPWGKFDSLESGDFFQVKLLTVNPGARLSVQRHQKRAEHWVVVSGRAKVTCNEKTFYLEKNESTFIPLGAIHCLENEEHENLEIIEVQSGTYFGEDDIERFDDIYGRI